MSWYIFVFKTDNIFILNRRLLFSEEDESKGIYWHYDVASAGSFKQAMLEFLGKKICCHFGETCPIAKVRKHITIEKVICFKNIDDVIKFLTDAPKGTQRNKEYLDYYMNFEGEGLT